MKKLLKITVCLKYTDHLVRFRRRTSFFAASFKSFIMVASLFLTAVSSFGQQSGYQDIYPASGTTLPASIPNGTRYILQGGSNAVFYGGNISIKNGAQLMIKQGATLKMTGEIVVEAGSVGWIGNSQYVITDGGRLVVTEQAKLTNNGVDKWAGIEVQGIPSSFPGGYQANQEDLKLLRGRITITDGFLENARCGIKTARRIGSVFISRGGIVQATRTDFTNNDTMAYIIGDIDYYPPKDDSAILKLESNGDNYFVKCNFILTPNFQPQPNGGSTILQRSMIRMEDVSAINFLACNFNNQKYVGNDFFEVNLAGITAFNSSFNVTNKYYEPQGVINIPGSWFGYIGLPHYGRSVFHNFYNAVNADGLTNLRVNIANTLFDNVAHGIWASALDFAHIHEDTFHLIQIGADPASGNTPVGDRTNAIEIIQNGWYFVYNNLIEGGNGNNLSYGIGIGDQVGHNQNNVHDNIIRNTKYALQGINNPPDQANMQTGLNAPIFTCNDFVTNNNTTTSVDVSSFMIGFAPRQYKIIPFSNGLKLLYNNRFNKKETNSSIAFNIYNDIENQSGSDFPYMEYAYNSNALYPNSYPERVQNVVKIPDNQTSDTCIDSLPPSRPNYLNTRNRLRYLTLGALQLQQQRDSLNASQYGEYINIYKEYQGLITNMVNYSLYYDTIGIQVDSLISVLKEAKLDYTSYLLGAKLYAQVGKYQEAIDLINEIPEIFTLNKQENSDITDLSTLYGIFKVYYKDLHGIWTDMPTSLRNVVNDFSSGETGITQRLAKTFLYMNAPSKDIALLDTYPWRIVPTSVTRQGNLSDLTAGFGLSYVYPNPTQGLLYLLRDNLKEPNQSFILRIYNTAGVEVLTKTLMADQPAIDVSALPQGSYFVQIIPEKGGKVLRDKFLKL